MDVSSVTIGVPVHELRDAMGWYRRVFELGEPELTPAEGVVEFKVGGVWLQLAEDSVTRSGAEVVTRFGVDDAAEQRARLVSLGVEAEPLEHVPEAVDYFDFVDPDGNRFSLYSEPAS